MAPSCYLLNNIEDFKNYCGCDVLYHVYQVLVTECKPFAFIVS